MVDEPRPVEALEQSWTHQQLRDARAWCRLNGWILPGGMFAASDAQRERIGELFKVLNARPGVLRRGLQLWRARVDWHLDPVTGKPDARRVFGEEPRHAE